MRNQDLAATWRHFDFWLLGAVILLVIFGVTMIRSAVAGNIELADLNLVNRQIIFAAAGFVVIFLVTLIDYRFWSSLSRVMYIGAFVLLAGLNIIGAALYGSARWFDTGVILIQPSEIAKIVLILTMADFFTRNKDRLVSLAWVARSFVYMMGLTIWILLQPNLSTSIVMMVLWASMLWVSGLQLRHLGLFAGGALLAPILGWPLMEEYQRARVLTFLFPDPNARHGDNYNIEQALISIGSGGWLGQGYGHGTQVQLRFLKVRWSDFIFSSMAQEFGFIGTVIVILVLCFVIYRILRAARLAGDTFGALICYGVATMIAFQAIVNMGVNLQLMPATGLTLPFVSYGGSSLLSTLLGIGLVESVIMRHRSLEF
ncbi:MAG: FtsW/RodA/SpoVE family cell cycle protein [Chloroflexota bacterium]